MKVSRWVIERDDSTAKFDSQVLSALAREWGGLPFEYTLIGGGEDPLLWPADLASWAFTKGERHASTIQHMVRENLEV